MHAGSGPLPWPITLHFRNFPADKLTRFSGEEVLKSHFYNMLKQVLCPLVTSPLFQPHSLSHTPAYI